MFAHLYVKPRQQTTVWDQPVYFLNDTSGHFQQCFWWQKRIFWIFPALSQNMIFSSPLTEWFLCPKPNQILTRALSQHKIEKIKCKEAQGFNMSTCCLVLHLCLYNISEEAVGWSAGELAARMIWRSRQRQCCGSILISKNYSDYSHWCIQICSP